MKYSNIKSISATNAATNFNSNAIDASTMISCSFQVVSTGTNLAGTVSLQASNDVASYSGNLPTLFVPTNWSTIPGQVVTLTASGASFINSTHETCYQYIRVAYASTATGVQTVTTVADVAKSLAGKYVQVSSGLGNSYAFWFKVSGTGSAPVVAGYTASEVDISTNDTATAVATALAAAMMAVNGGLDFSAVGVGAVVTVTNITAGSFIPALAGTSGFTIAAVTPNGTISVQLKFGGL